MTDHLYSVCVDCFYRGLDTLTCALCDDGDAHMPKEQPKAVAWCMADGVITISEQAPEGSRTIATGGLQVLTKVMGCTARHGHEPGVLLVPGIPEAANLVDAEDALLDWVDWINSCNREGITFPLAGKGKVNRSTSAERFQRSIAMLAEKD